MEKPAEQAAEALQLQEGAQRQSAQSYEPPAAMLVSYGIEMTPMPDKGHVLVSFKFASPPALAGKEAFYYTLSHHDAGVFARKLEKTRNILEKEMRKQKA